MSNKSLFYALIPAVIYGSLVAPNTSAEQALKQHSAPQAQALEIDNFAGELLIKSSNEPGIRLKMTGSKQQLDDLTVTVADGVLRFTNTRSHGIKQTTLIRHNILALATNGAKASVSINGQEFNAQDSTKDLPPPVYAELVVQKDLPLTLQTFSGQAQIEARTGLVYATLTAGTMNFTDLQNAHLLISGSGDIQVGTAQGRLDTLIKGSGTIRVADAELSLLIAQIQGVGNLYINGNAEQAELQLRGAGNIHIDSVQQQPQVHLAGVGTITVGNWQRFK